MAFPAPPSHFKIASSLLPPKPPAGPFVIFGETRNVSSYSDTILMELEKSSSGTLDLRPEMHRELEECLSKYMSLLKSFLSEWKGESDSDNDGAWMGYVESMSKNLRTLHELLNKYHPFFAKQELISHVRSQIERKKSLLEEAKTKLHDSSFLLSSIVEHFKASTDDSECGDVSVLELDEKEGNEMDVDDTKYSGEEKPIDIEMRRGKLHLSERLSEELRRLSGREDT